MAGGVLVVDDDPEIREVLELVLRSEGHDVALAGDGLAALEQLERRRPALVLLDLAMPRMDGAALVEALRRRGLYPGIPILVLSAAHGADEAAARLGVEGFVAKPFDLDVLLAEVGRLVESPAAGHAAAERAHAAPAAG